MQGNRREGGSDSQALISLSMCLTHSLEPVEAGPGKEVQQLAELGESRRLE